MKESLNCLKHCRALCCSRPNIYLLLTQKEASLLKTSGTKLDIINSFQNDSGRMLFQRVTKCGFLVDGNCCIHPELTMNEDLRPVVCKGFIVGGKACLVLRVQNPDYVIKITPEDEVFQRWWNGYED